MNRPNLLGRILRYVVDGAEYAQTGKARGQSNMYAPILAAQTSGIGRYYNDGLGDSGAAEKLAITCSWIWSDISLIADRVAGETWEVKRRQGEELIDLDNHDFEVLWANPGGTYSGALLAKYTAWWYLLRGNGYIFVASDSPGRGEPRELWPLEAGAIAPEPSTVRRHVITGRPVIDYSYTINGERKIMPGENVVHFRFPNPWDFWEGLSPLTALTTAIDLDLGARRWQRDFFRKDNAVPVAIVQMAPEMSKQEFDIVVDDVKRLIDEGHRLLFARSGDLDIKTIQATVEQMQILETRNLSRDEIDRVYHVPSGIFTGGTSGDAQQAAEIALGRNCIQPILDFFAAELTYKIAPFYGEDIVIAAPNVVPQDRALEVAEYNTYRPERSINESRLEQDLDEMGDLDKLTIAGIPITKVPLRILDLAQAGQISIKDETVPPPVTPPQLVPFTGQQPPEGEQPEEPQGETEEGEGETEQGTPSLPQMEAPEQQVSNLARAAWLGVETEMGRWEKVAIKEMREGRRPEEREFESAIIPLDIRDAIKAALILADTEAQVKTAFEPPFFFKATRITAGGKADPNAEGKDFRESRFARIWKVNLSGERDKIVAALGDPPDLTKLDNEFWMANDNAVMRAIRPELEAMALEAANTAMGFLPIGFDWGLIADDAAQWAGQHAGELIANVDATTKRAVARKVQQYIETPGTTMGELRESLESQFGTIRAESIAVTEVTNAYARGQDIIANRAREVGFNLEDVWQTNRDELVCPICGPNDGKKKSTGWTVSDIPAHPRCRCWKNAIWQVA